MITNIESYFSKGCGRCDRFDTPDCSTKQWQSGLNALRHLCNSSGLTETVKWGHPCYMHADRNIALIGAFRQDFRLTFFNAALLQDANNRLEKQGPNTQHANMIRFTDNAQPAALRADISELLAQAMHFAAEGIVAPKTQHALSLPEEFIDALDADPALADAFFALTPGRQRSYEIALNGAKQSATRLARIAKYRNKIMLGKGANER